MKKQKFDLEAHKAYVAFLKKRVESKNYKANVSEDEYKKTKDKYDKAKLILKLQS